MKWIGRILYFVFVILIFGFIEFTLMGVEGIMRSEYASEHILDAARNDEDYNVFEGLDRFSAAIDTYYSRVQIKNLDNSNYYDTTTETIDAKYQVKIGMYPFVSLLKDPNVDIYYDGFIIVFENYDDSVAFYSLDITAYNVNDTTKKKIALTEGEYLNVYPNVDGFIVNQRVPYTTYLHNTYFYTAEQASLEGPFEYHVLSIDVYANFLVDGETTKEFIYRMTDGTEDYTGSPMVTHENLNLAPESYNISKHLNGELPTVENNPYNLVLTYHPADFSPYTYFYFIVYGLYFVLIVVIPYFWFFHKKVMRLIKKDQPLPPTHTPSGKDMLKRQQIFSDIEPKGDE